MLIDCHTDQRMFNGVIYFNTSFRQKTLFRMTFFLLTIGGCVEPPEYNDGLLENIPAIVNEADFFSFSIKAEGYTNSLNYDLEFSATNTNVLNTSLVVKDYSGQSSDSTFIRLYNENNAMMLDVLVNENVSAFSQDSVLFIGNPQKMEFIGAEFTGLIDFQILRQ
ncbi:MAG: hypothetical protein VX600_05235 [Candidatus Neomarinimicrobiota bacterium]|uniref:Uncharacterized protein n=1 Tax=marine metagenome TaxID=408172 RepID=A0A381XV68_9ZZZZ|nr:hypothetical protein [Candidatus Neomarinimicrobiota bacterium]|tara:strand:+ start:406 stop:900 length:495 start_codon:yes stop_codon:yes gene_type:complete